MKKILTTLLFATVLIGASSSAFSAPTFATDEADYERIALTPDSTRLTLRAGDTMHGTFKVTNDGKITYSFSVYAKPFSVSGEQYDPNFTEVNEKTRAYEWVTFEQTIYQLRPSESIEVPYTISAPAMATGGGHYAILFAETQPEADETTNILRKKRVGSLLYLTIDSELSEAGSVDSWTVPFWQTEPPVSSLLRLKNSGNVHYQADVQMSYTSLVGSNKFDFRHDFFILPGTTRRIPIEWTDSPRIGLYKAEGMVSYLGKQESLNTTYILLLPPYILWLTAALLSFLALITIKITKRRRRRSLATQTLEASTDS